MSGVREKVEIRWNGMEWNGMEWKEWKMESVSKVLSYW
jgi:hypothetical protein